MEMFKNEDMAVIGVVIRDDRGMIIASMSQNIAFHTQLLKLKLWQQ